MPAFDVDEQMDGIADAAFDGFVRKLNSTLQDAIREPGQCLAGLENPGVFIADDKIKNPLLGWEQDRDSPPLLALSPTG